MSQWRELARNGLWSNNPALVQLLGLCPLLAVSGSVVNALGLAFATLLVMVGASTTISLIRHQVPSAVRLPAFVMVIAAFVTCAELLMAAFAYSLYQVLGIFIPLIVTNCAILGRADAFASRQPVIPAAIDGFMMGLGFGAVLILLGALRELLGQGTLFSDMELLFGPIASNWQLTFVDDYQFLFFVLPPGAFFVAGLLIALKNVIDQRRSARAQPVQAVSRTERRVRVTGTIK
ncbi:electron transport complex subunit E [Vreelandella venusta]|uniref:Ion-translocating oxidoreductase complex subunit E n=1 Tax=Vreelandella venusta TaxID=44935 RepID=A0AAP9ZP18_9GAMM|nr:electron transport complex subunit E [Halomonas venusta]AZM96031.1 electron transport complex subunit E [Halomonas venusta]MDW0357969.1 electron transport complex subunit E [Halomonas venusta]NPT30682.1 electron transport complex subunit RsxE [Halomonas venusta]QPI62360.1 electron transport complex subunit E [Halomonas venusta]QRL05202.1 electron transport complex subunit E [Halomonas venusta]